MQYDIRPIVTAFDEEYSNVVGRTERYPTC